MASNVLSGVTLLYLFFRTVIFNVGFNLLVQILSKPRGTGANLVLLFNNETFFSDCPWRNIFMWKCRVNACVEIMWKAS